MKGRRRQEGFELKQCFCSNAENRDLSTRNEHEELEAECKKCRPIIERLKQEVSELRRRITSQYHIYLLHLINNNKKENSSNAHMQHRSQNNVIDV